MDFGVFVGSGTFEDTLRRAVDCERLGFHSVWVADHPYLGRRLEPWVTLSILAAKTQKIRLGHLVNCNNYRPPPLHACMAASLDSVSEGRLEFGIGAGWAVDEYKSVGLTFPKAGVRIAQLNEGIEVIKRMWMEEAPRYEGKYYRINEPGCPKPVQKPHPPIMVGTALGEKILRVVARHADKWNVVSTSVSRGTLEGSPSEYRRKLGILEKYCSELDRDFDKIDKTLTSIRTAIAHTPQKLEEEVKDLPRPQGIPLSKYVKQLKMMGIVGTVEECIEKIQEYGDMGVNLIILGLESAESRQIFHDEVVPCI